MIGVQFVARGWFDVQAGGGATGAKATVATVGSKDVAHDGQKAAPAGRPAPHLAQNLTSGDGAPAPAGVGAAGVDGWFSGGPNGSFIVRLPGV